MQIYEPAEDSYFLSEILKEKINSKKISSALDMGSGPGIQAQNLISLGISQEKITLIDINLSAIKRLKKSFPKSKIIYSDLFSKIKDKFDLIVFNPPYLPGHKYDKLPDTTGGKKGDEIILRFLKNLQFHLTQKGKCFLLASSLTPMGRIKKQFEKYKVKKIATKKLFQEELYVWEIKRDH